MSVDSFGMTMTSLPAPTAPSAPSLGPVSAKKQAASDNSSTASASSTDPLMAALQQTLSRLGYSMPAGSLATSAASGTDSSGGSSTDAVSASNSDATSTGAQFLAARYQALALQQSISADNGGTSSGNRSANAIASFNDSATSGGVCAYRDLGSRIAELSTPPTRSTTTRMMMPGHGMSKSMTWKCPGQTRQKMEKIRWTRPCRI